MGIVGIVCKPVDLGYTIQNCPVGSIVIDEELRLEADPCHIQTTLKQKLVDLLCTETLPSTVWYK